MVKVEFVKAEFKKIYEQKKVQIPTGEKHKSFFGLLDTEIKKTKYVNECIGVSDTEIDGVKLAEDISNKIDELQSEGFIIKQMVPIISGKYDYYSQGIKSSRRSGFWDETTTEKISGGESYGYGYSFTEGVLIYAEK